MNEEISTENEKKGLISKQLKQHLKLVIEALLFASSDPLTLNKIREITDKILALSLKELRSLMNELAEEYITQKRAFKLEEIASGYVLRTYEEYAPYIEQLVHQKKSDKLSQASTEVLAIIAYRQPITRAQIEAIRGVDCTGPIMQLCERQLIEPIGKLETVGKPTLYGTTKEFMKHFGLKNLKELKNSGSIET